MSSNHSSINQGHISRRGLGGVVAITIGLTLAVAIGLWLVGVDPSVGVFLPLAIGAIVLGLWSPYWIVVLTAAQCTVLPVEGHVLGQFVPNALQLLAPTALGSALLQVLRRRDNQLLRLRLVDFCVGAFGLFGLVGMFATPGHVRWKWYGNSVLFPMLIYYAVGLIPLTTRKTKRLLLILTIAVTSQAAFMIYESVNWGSWLYGTHSSHEIVEGIPAAIGPFGFMWDAATYLAVFPPLLIYFSASSRGWWGKLTWIGCLLVVLTANTRTMERAGLGASLVAVAFCLLSPRLRRTTIAVVGLLAIAYVPWSLGQPGDSLMARFDQTDQSRFAFRTAGVNIMKSSRWNPLFGIGWARTGDIAGTFGTEEIITAWGHTTKTVAAVAAGSKLHNVWLAIPLEFGLGGTVLFLGIIGGLCGSLSQILRAARTGAEIDDGLLVAVLGGLVALGAVGWYHNIYCMVAPMVMLWVLYGILVAHPHIFIGPRGRQGRDKLEPD